MEQKRKCLACKGVGTIAVSLPDGDYDIEMCQFCEGSGWIVIVKTYTDRGTQINEIPYKK